MSFETFVAKKYFRAKRKTGFISIITFVSITGVTIGVTALIIVLSVMNGFESEVRSKLIDADAHIRLRKFYTQTITEIDKLIATAKKHPEVIGASPVIREESMIRSSHAQRPTAVKAIDLNTIESVSNIRQKVILGELDFSEKEINGKKLRGIVLGRYLADRLLALDIGEVVTLFTLPKEGSVFSQPRVMQFYLAGIVEFGYYEYDRIFSFISLESAQKLFNMPEGISWVEIKLNDYNKASKVASEIEEELGYPYTTLTWFELNKSLFSWMEIEKWGAFIILSLIIMVAAFNIISSLIMIVMEKTREIGILKSMGATSNSVMKIFMYEGIIIGLIGTFLGCLIGYTVGFLQLNYKIISLPADVYIIDSVPIELHLIDFIAISSVALFLCFLASVYPAFKLHVYFQWRRYVMSKILTTKQLYKTYMTGPQEVEVLKGIDLEVSAGEIVVIMGPSGVGKSTLLHLVGGLDRPTEGEVLIDGENLFSLRDRELAIFRNSAIGFVFQFHHLLPEFTAHENVMIPGMMHGRDISLVEEKAKNILDEIGLAQRLNHKPSELSGGEQQRVAVARALVNSPRLILADEPTGNLDKQNSQALYELILDLNKKHDQTFIIVTHNELMAKHAQRVIELEDGKIKNNLTAKTQRK